MLEISPFIIKFIGKLDSVIAPAVSSVLIANDLVGIPDYIADIIDIILTKLFGIQASRFPDNY